MRPVRKKIKFDEDSVNKLLQEIYNDTCITKAKITRLFTKWELKIKETGEIAAIGDQIVKLIAAEAKNQDQKIMLLKFLKEVVFEDKAKSNKIDVEVSDDVTTSISADRRNELLSFVQHEVERKSKIKK